MANPDPLYAAWSRFRDIYYRPWLKDWPGHPDACPQLQPFMQAFMKMSVTEVEDAMVIMATDSDKVWPLNALTRLRQCIEEVRARGIADARGKQPLMIGHGTVMTFKEAVAQGKAKPLPWEK